MDASSHRIHGDRLRKEWIFQFFNSSATEVIDQYFVFSIALFFFCIKRKSAPLGLEFSNSIRIWVSLGMLDTKYYRDWHRWLEVMSVQHERHQWHGKKNQDLLSDTDYWAMRLTHLYASYHCPVSQLIGDSCSPLSMWPRYSRLGRRAGLSETVMKTKTKCKSN